MGLGLSQPEFSRLFCVDSQTVARWEKGESAVTPIIDWAVRLEVVRRWQPALQAIEFPQARHRDSSPSPIELEYVNGSWRKADVRHSAHVQLALLAQAEADIAKARRAVDDFFVSDMSKMVAESRSLSAAMEEQAKMYFLELNRLRPEYSSEKPVSVTALLSAGPTEEDKESA
jgi:transcriptional regulator with XRE-family HTH domain